MHRRQFLRGVAGSIGLASIGAAGAHPGPYRPLGKVPITNAKEAVPDENGEVAYVAATDGFATVDVRVPSDPQLLAERRDLLSDRETGPLRLIQDAKVEGDRLALVGPANPLEGDVLQGLVVYDVSDPTDPQQIGFYETSYPIHNCDIDDGVVYLTANDGETNSLVAVDAGDGEVTELGQWSLLDRDESWREVAGPLRTLHDVRVRDDRAYLAYWDAGTYILDVSDSADPAFVSRIGGRPRGELAEISGEEGRNAVIGLPGNAHYATTDESGDLLGINREAWAVDGDGGPGGVELWDVSDETAPEQLAAIEAPASSDPSIGGTWTTSHNFDIVGDRLFTSWYQGGVKIHDISDPANPEELAWWRDPDEAAFWTAKLATEKFFVASSMGRRANGKGALYAFPNHAGEQKDPPALTTTATGTETADETTVETTITTETTTTTQQAALDEDEETTEANASGDAPGFGAPAAVAALLGAGAWRTFRQK
ncbi:hypothetical protein BRC82_02360 [Halobacteriales archaeon QS_1_67_19]|nr:MAG: hypothetical protein BRC82_02360 [Halobacteriales archaeon QS_1_67_19]